MSGWILIWVLFAAIFLAGIWELYSYEHETAGEESPAQGGHSICGHRPCDALSSPVGAGSAVMPYAPRILMRDIDTARLPAPAADGPNFDCPIPGKRGILL